MENKVPYNDPQNYSIWTYLWVLALSAWGGISHNIERIKKGELKKFRFVDLIYDIVVSGFIGILTFWLCEYANLDGALSAVFIGVSAHMGTRAIAPLEKIFVAWSGGQK